jgi:hypothetical protein
MYTKHNDMCHILHYGMVGIIIARTHYTFNTIYAVKWQSLNFIWDIEESDLKKIRGDIDV